jgi:hypothetical protein
VSAARTLLSSGVLAAVSLASACGPKNSVDPSVPTTGEAFNGESMRMCSVERPATEPDLMAWDGPSRANLNRLRAEGLPVVKLTAKGCNVQLELLSHCVAKSKTPFTYSAYPKRETKEASTVQELFAKLPLGAARFQAELKGNRALRTDYMLVGQFSIPAQSRVAVGDLEGGDCARATHVVTSIYVGGFRMAAGDKRVMGGGVSLFSVEAGARRDAEVRVLDEEGNSEACETAMKSEKETQGCTVPLRLALYEIEGRSATPPGTSPDVPREPTQAGIRRAAAPPGPAHVVKVPRTTIPAW